MVVLTIPEVIDNLLSPVLMRVCRGKPWKVKENPKRYPQKKTKNMPKGEINST